MFEYRFHITHESIKILVHRPDKKMYHVLVNKKAQKELYSYCITRRRELTTH